MPVAVFRPVGPIVELLGGHRFGGNGCHTLGPPELERSGVHHTQPLAKSPVVHFVSYSRNEVDYANSVCGSRPWSHSLWRSSWNDCAGANFWKVSARRSCALCNPS